MSNPIAPDGCYVLKEPVSPPEILDMLVVGGGPAGTAAAFRAKELGLTALVIDYDDLMKRIRDYAKGKPILPSFGGGDNMQFPKGEDLISKLHFEPIDKDDMCTEWRQLYHDASIPAQVGVELTGMTRRDDGVWSVETWNHKQHADQIILARHVVIAIGRGVPRRFDIPGNIDGISYRMDDPVNFVGAPVCIVGGGTSAAEAVIAISNAKAAAQDETPVCWSYRGNKMPRVSRALSEVFFDAYVGNGNIYYYPHSEPVAVVTAPDHNDYLSLRIDRRTVEDRPNETSHLEFDKRFCMACIGEDLPEALLGQMNISLMTGGPRNKKRVTVSPLLESQQANVYLVGDLLSQVYLETNDFEADPTTFHEIKHPGNVKSSLRDGVFIAEVIRQKLDGNDEIKIELEFVENKVETEAPSIDVAAATEETDGPPAESIPDDRRDQSEPAVLVKMTPAGVEEDEFPISANASIVIGKAEGDLKYPKDDALVDKHATVFFKEGGLFVRDEGSQTGTYVQLVPGETQPLTNGDLVRLGQQILVFKSDSGKASFTHYDASGQTVGIHDLKQGETIVLGRDAPDITLDADDTVLSRRHLSVSFRKEGLFVKDLKSLNNSLLRIRGEQKLEADDVIRLGHQIFRISLSAELPSAITTFKPKPFVEEALPETILNLDPASPAAPAAPAKEGVASVTYEGTGKTLEISAKESICDLAENNGVTITAECHAGICGSDPIRIVSGGDQLNEITDEEADTLEDICDLEAGNGPGQCRLACMTRSKGPVTIEIVEP